MSKTERKPALDRWVRPEVLAMDAYHVQSLPHRIKLNQNESPWDWPGQFKASVLRQLGELDWNRYPDRAPLQLKERLAQTVDLAPEQVVLGKGSNEVLQALATVLLRPGDRLCTLDPTFAVYSRLAQLQGATVETVPLDDDFQVTPADLLAAAGKARLTILCNPNSPTGSLLDLELIDRVAASAAGVVVVDEAYLDFARVTALDLLAARPNLVLTRTFSKALALAGFRLGYGIMQAELAAQVQKGLLPYNIDVPAAVAGMQVLEQQGRIVELADLIITERDDLIAKLNELPGITAWSSHTNFFLLETPMGAQGTFRRLAKLGLLVRDVSGYRLCQRKVRITVGTPEENSALYQAVETLA